MHRLDRRLFRGRRLDARAHGVLALLPRLGLYGIALLGLMPTSRAAVPITPVKEDLVRARVNLTGLTPSFTAIGGRHPGGTENATLEVRKSVRDAVVPPGGQAEFLIDIGNVGPDDLTDVTVSDTLDPSWLVPPEGDPGLVFEDSLCAGCTISFNADSTVITIGVPAIPPTDEDGDGLFDDDEGFRVVNLVARTPLSQATFPNRVTVRSSSGLSDTDIAAVVTFFDEPIFEVVNDDFRLTPSGDLTDVENFQVGDSIVYQTRITNRSGFLTATNVQVLWEVAPDFGLIRFERVLDASPASISCSAAEGTCSVTVESLDPGGSIVLSYLTSAQLPGRDVNRITLTANESSMPLVNEELTTVNQLTCAGFAVTLVGTDENDFLVGTAAADVIHGLAGADQIDGRGGDDVLCGGSGFDVLIGGEGADRLQGGEGNNGLMGGAGDDLLVGGAGNDVLEGGEGEDQLFGGEGNDMLFGQLGRDVADGGPGAEQLFGGEGNDTLRGRSGNDKLHGGLGDDTLEGGLGFDRCDGADDVLGDTAEDCEEVVDVP